MSKNQSEFERILQKYKTLYCQCFSFPWNESNFIRNIMNPSIPIFINLRYSYREIQHYVILQDKNDVKKNQRIVY